MAVLIARNVQECKTSITLLCIIICHISIILMLNLNFNATYAAINGGRHRACIRAVSLRLCSRKEAKARGVIIIRVRGNVTRVREDEAARPNAIRITAKENAT